MTFFYIFLPIYMVIIYKIWNFAVFHAFLSPKIAIIMSIYQHWPFFPLIFKSNLWPFSIYFYHPNCLFLINVFGLFLTDIMYVIFLFPYFSSYQIGNFNLFFTVKSGHFWLKMWNLPLSIHAKNGHYLFNISWSLDIFIIF